MRRLSLLFLAGYATQACAAFDYEVDLNAPKEVRGLLRAHLELEQWRGNPQMSQDQLERLVKDTPAQARALLATAGYFSPEVVATLQHPPGQPWIAHVLVRPSEPVKVVEVQIGLEGPITHDPDYAQRLATLRQTWALPVGTVFTQLGWSNSKRKGQMLLAECSYPAARLGASHAEIDPATHHAVLRVIYQSGPAFTLGDLRITGLTRYPRSIIDHLATFKAGTPYRQQTLLDFQAKIASTPYFTSAYVTTANDPEHPKREDVLVQVQEAPQQKLGFGVGYDSDTGARAELNHQYYNFLQRGWVLESGVRIEQQQRSAGLQVTLPTASTGYVWSGFSRWERQDVQNLRTDRARQGVTATRQEQNVTTTYGIQYVGERTRPAGGVSNRTQALTPSTSWTLRTLDDPLKPTRGYAWRTDLSGAVQGLLSDTSFFRVYSKGLQYLPISPRWGRFLLRTEIGQVFTHDSSNVPNDNLFQTGGATTVRGYGYNSIGIKTGADAVKGGRVFGVGSMEYQYPLRPNWYLALFSDAGDATSRWQDFDAKLGYGSGVRWLSPVGPLAIDVAYGQAVHAWALHFSFSTSF